MDWNKRGWRRCEKMFDEIANQKRALSETGFGVIAAFVLVMVFFGPIFYYVFFGLAVNGYESIPFIGWVDTHTPQYSWLDDIATIALLACVSSGLLQMFYLVPIFFVARTRGYVGFARGLIIGAALIFLLQSACTGVLYISVR